MRYNAVPGALNDYTLIFAERLQFMNALFLTDAEGRSLPRKEKILYVLLALFFATLYIPDNPVINNVFIALIFVYSFFYNTISEKLRLLRQRKAVVCMLLFYLLQLVSAFFSANKEEATRMLGMRIPLLMFPIAIGLIYLRLEIKERILLLYAVTTTIAAFLCLASAFLVFQKTHESSYLYNDSLSDLIGIQSIYFALMVNLAVFVYVYFLTQKTSFNVSRPLIFLAIFFLLGIHFLLASRIAIIVLYSALLVFAFYYIIRKRKILEGLTLIIGLLIGSIAMVKLFPKTLNRFREMLFTEYNYDNKGVESHYDMAVTADQWNGANIRLAIWKCGWELARQYPVFGAGLGDKKDKMMEIYQTKHFDFALKTKRNMHNNYLDVLCTVGIVGLVLFLLAYFVFPIISSYKAGDALGVFIIAAFAFSLITETYLDRSLGCVLFSFFASLIAGYKKPVARD